MLSGWVNLGPQMRGVNQGVTFLGSVIIEFREQGVIVFLRKLHGGP